ncbi:LysM peptidoglycan-binding domain-containing protein [Brevibacillus migulae]|uniref:LysM peptidoglycan-binding domain-containing protein n=1 Tax=Brevibacillus migulae TaxID=1644114 RepID=UPI0014301226|nr:LysM peptidoglycan-binding domain-containing protein [Brevibacillus migulae]
MALQDGLLSFQIKETVFLSSDKAGIGELKELELVPDVEIIENPQEISITGCLQLFGKYDPYQGKAEEDSEETDTLVAAMKFTPFQLEERQTGSFLSAEEQTISHRIPLNISIPLNRVEEVAEIYAIVDSFDYHLETANCLQIHANLKIAGIQLRDLEVEKTAKADEEAWEFVHSLSQEVQPVADHQPRSLEEIERKLAALEEEILLQEKRDESAKTASSANLFIAQEASFASEPEMEKEEPRINVQPAFSPLPPSQPLFGDVSSVHLDNLKQDIEPVAYTNQEPEAEPEAEATPTLHAEEWHEQSTAVSYEQEDREESVPAAAEAQEETAEPVAEPEALEAAEVATEEEEEAEPVFAEAPLPAAEAQEMKVAIGSKHGEETDAKVNITSLFTQSKKAQTQKAAVEQESSSSSSRAVADTGKNSEAVSNLTSFVRQGEERMSKVRIAILQRNETLESIADRYSIPVSRILEANNVSSDRITEGQILYIPQ